MQESETQATSQPAETAEASPQPRPSLAERLLNQEPSPPDPAPRVQLRPERRANNWAPPSVQSGLAPADRSIKDVRRFIILRYAVFLASILATFVLLVIGSAVFIAELLGAMGWEKLAVSGGLAGVSLCALVLLQYRPARSFGLAASRWAQLEAARNSLLHSNQLWDEFLAQREAAGQLSPNDVSAAVASIAAAVSRAFAGLDAAPPRVPQTGQSRTSQLPTPAAPDPHRYS